MSKVEKTAQAKKERDADWRGFSRLAKVMLQGTRT
jgi:hypothetical protein